MEELTQNYLEKEKNQQYSSCSEVASTLYLNDHCSRKHAAVPLSRLSLSKENTQDTQCYNDDDENKISFLKILNLGKLKESHYIY